MIAATDSSAGSLSNETPAFRSAIFQFPGRPLPLARRLAVYNRVKRLLREFMEDQRFNEVPAPVTRTEAYLDSMLDRGFPAVWSESQISGGDIQLRQDDRRELIRAMGAELDQEALVLLQGILLRTIVENLSADLLGGRQITRLDRVLTCEHARFEYGHALEFLADHGHPVEFGQPLDQKTATDLSRFCSNQPVLVTDIPAAMAGPDLGLHALRGPDVQYSGYILPYSGLTMVGVAKSGDKFRGGVTVDLGRFLQFLMGLEHIGDTVISPRQGMAGA
jgi:hypothetical protein